jgi:hypothetical protein
VTKKSAILLSGGAALALVAIVAALALNLGALRASSASAAGSQKPIVKTIVKTIHHRVKPKASKAPLQTVIVHRPTTSGSSASIGASHGDDGFEHEGEGFDD